MYIVGDYINTGRFLSIDHNYRYADGLNMRPGGSLHDKVLNEVMQRARHSRNHMSKRYDSWNKVDRLLNAYVSPEDVKKSQDDPKRIVPVNIPLSYAMLEILLTYIVGTFLQDPIFRYKGNGPEDVLGAILLEKNIGMQCVKMKVGLQLHTMFRDAFAYSTGLVIPVWEQMMGMVKREDEGGMFTALNTFIPNQNGRREFGVAFEGNRLENIDPYSMLLDINVPLHEIQKAEFIGWIKQDGYLNLLRQEQERSDLFNVKYVKETSGKSALGESAKARRGAGQSDKTRIPDARVWSSSSTPVDVIYMYIDLIPKDWALGTSEYPERWLFGVAADSVVIKASKISLNHNMMPAAICVPNYDGYGTSPVSTLELSGGMNDLINWFYTSHVANVKRAINDSLVVDPSMINIADLKSSEPGKIIRLRKRVWGRGVKDAVEQLKINDVTRGHINDASSVTDVWQKVQGIGDMFFGAVRSGGERRSATEYRETKIGALSRIEKCARIASLQAMTDIAMMFASNTQQFMTKEGYADITGDWEETLTRELAPERISKGFVRVKPSDLDINYDIVFQDGSMAGNEYIESWVQVFQMVAGNETLTQNLDAYNEYASMFNTIAWKDFVDTLGGELEQKRLDTCREKDVQEMLRLQGAVAQTEYILTLPEVILDDLKASEEEEKLKEKEKTDE